MSAPAALATAKILLPETAPKAKESHQEEEDIEAQRVQIRQAADVTRSSSGNLLDAATQGASSAALLVLNITAIVVAFISFIAFLNSVVSFFGGIIGHPEITFEWILGYMFVPVAFIMGIDFSECHQVGRLLGIKSVANEFIAYRELGLLIQSADPLLSKRAVIITTYALCGFANPGSIGVQIATLGSLCPERKGDVGRVIFRAFIGGTAACFMTACIAGALIQD